jgi:Bacterial Ig domain
MKLRMVRTICAAALLLTVRSALGASAFTPAVPGSLAAPTQPSAFTAVIPPTNATSQMATGAFVPVIPPPAPPVVTITVAGPGDGTFQVARTGSLANALTVFYLVGGTATNGLDYQMISSNVTIAANSGTNFITITPIGQPDTLADLNSTVALQLIAPPTNQPPYTVGSPSRAAVTIADVIAMSTNQPAVGLIAPRDGAAFAAGTDVLLAATASSTTNRNVINVEFFANTFDLGPGALIASGGEGGAVFAFDWIGVPAGQYAISAVATDSAGATTVSAPAHISVQ